MAAHAAGRGAFGQAGAQRARAVDLCRCGVRTARLPSEAPREWGRVAVHAASRCAFGQVGAQRDGRRTAAPTGVGQSDRGSPSEAPREWGRVVAPAASRCAFGQAGAQRAGRRTAAPTGVGRSDSRLPSRAPGSGVSGGAQTVSERSRADRRATRNAANRRDRQCRARQDADRCTPAGGEWPHAGYRRALGQVGTGRAELRAAVFDGASRHAEGADRVGDAVPDSRSWSFRGPGSREGVEVRARRAPAVGRRWATDPGVAETAT
jgi:hypothetical protein